MAWSASDIAAAVQGHVEGDATRQVSNAAGLSEACESDLSFFHNPKYANDLALTRAGVVLVPEDTTGLTRPPTQTWIRVSHPQFAYGRILGLIEKTRRRHPQGRHPNAVIHPDARVDSTAGIGPFVTIEAGAEIGARSVLYPGCSIGARSRIGPDSILYSNVTVCEDVDIGARAIIHSGAVLGADGYGFATVEGRHQKIPQIGRVVVEEDVEIGANSTIDRATTGETRIGAGTKIDNLVHIAHNVRIGRDCLIVAQVGISGSTKVGHHVTLAGQVGVIGHLTIGDGAVIAAQSGIIGDVEPGAVLFGSPARPHRVAMKLQALYGRLPELFDLVKKLRKGPSVS